MGLLPGEGYAEKIVTPEGMTLPIPSGLSFEKAASIPEVFMTVYDALFNQARLKGGEKLLLHAVGSGVGTAAVQLAKAAGSTVLGTAGSEDKVLKAHRLGLDAGANYRQEDFHEMVMAETNGQGVDAIVDLVGAGHWDRKLACLAPRGRLVLVGLVGGGRGWRRTCGPS